MRFILMIFIWAYSGSFLQISQAAQPLKTSTINKIRKYEQEIVDAAKTLNGLIASHCPVCSPLTLPVELGITVYEIATKLQKQSVIFSNNWVIANRCIKDAVNNNGKESSVCTETLDLVCEDQCTRFRCLSPRIAQECQKLCTTPARAKAAKICLATKTVWGQLSQCGPVKATTPLNEELQRAETQLEVEESVLSNSSPALSDAQQKTFSPAACSSKKRKTLCLLSCTGSGPSPTCADEDIQARCSQYCNPNDIKACLKTEPGTSWHRAIQCREAQDVLEKKIGKTVAEYTKDPASPKTGFREIDPGNYYVVNEGFCKKNYKAACKARCTKYACSDALVKEECKRLCDVDETVQRNRTSLAKRLGADTADKTLREYAASCLLQRPGCIVR